MSTKPSTRNNSNPYGIKDPKKRITFRPSVIAVKRALGIRYINHPLSFSTVYTLADGSR